MVATRGFNAEKFISMYGERTDDGLWCRNFQLTKEEVAAIQTQDFVISLDEKVYFEDCDIGVLSEKLISKFPNATKLTFSHVVFQIAPSTQMDYPWLESLWFDNCEIRMRNRVNIRGLEKDKVKYKILDSKFTDIKQDLADFVIIGISKNTEENYVPHMSGAMHPTVLTRLHEIVWRSFCT
ncbi:hypothetical protein ACFFRR_000264 [Megaselia abdita]